MLATQENPFEMIQAQFCEEAAFLWFQRNQAMRAPQYNLSDIIELDERVTANLAGLQLAGETGWQLALNAWKAFPESGEWFVLVSQYFSMRGKADFLPAYEELVHKYFQALSQGSELQEKEAAMRTAAQWYSGEQIHAFVKFLLDSGCSEQALLALELAEACLCVLGTEEEISKKIFILANNATEAQMIRLMRLIQNQKLSVCQPLLESLVNNESEPLAFAATYALSHLMPRQSVDRLAAYAQKPGVYQFQAMDLWLRIMPLPHSRQLMEYLQKGSDKRLYLKACASRGAIEDISGILECMGDIELARLAGETFSTIIGVDLFNNANLVQDPPEAYLKRIDQHDDDPYLIENDPDEELPWPKQAAVVSWWENNKTAFEGDLSYFCGHIKCEEAFYSVLRNGYQRQRLAAATELDLMTKDPLVVDVCAPSFRQEEMLKCCS